MTRKVRKIARGVISDIEKVASKFKSLQKRVIREVGLTWNQVDEQERYSRDES
jgi:hypothetical protein